MFIFFASLKAFIIKNASEKEIQNLIIDEFTLVNGEYSLFMDYLTSNIDDSKYIVYGYIRQTEQEGIYFIGLFKKHIKKNQPKGQVIYIRTKKGNMYCLYSYLTVTNPGSILVRKRVKVKLKDFS